MSGPEVLVVPTGTANIASVMAALPAPGRWPRLAEDAARSSGRPTSCCPGSVLRRRDGAAGRVGLDHALARGSPPTGRRSACASATRCCSRPATRARRAAGLPWSPAVSAASPATVRVPQFGWNRCSPNTVTAARGRLRLFRQQLSRDRGAGLGGRDGDAWRPLRRRDGAGQRARLPVPPRAVGRIRRGTARALLEALMLTSRIIPASTSATAAWSRASGSRGCATRAIPPSAPCCTRHRRRRDRDPRRLGHPRRPRQPGRDGPARARAPRHPADGRRRGARSRTCAHLLEAGADKVSVNTAAVQRPELLSEIAARFGRQCMRDRHRRRAPRRAASRCWSRAGARAPASTRSSGRAQASSRGAGEILLTSWDRDGTRAGYDLALTRAVARGGVRAGDRLGRRGDA